MSLQALSPRTPGHRSQGSASPAAAGQPRLAFERVNLSFAGHAAVSDVSLAVQPGEIACLLGPSGCGKTTLLRIAAGIEVQDRGRVLIDGAEVAGPARTLPPEARGVGLVFQDYALFPHLTILDNVRFGLKGRPAGEAIAAAREALERVRLAHHAGHYPHNLSGGEQQRVALARALVPGPRVLLMDEPFSGLDRRLRDKVRDETLAVLRENGATAVVVTHDPEEAMRIGDRIALMRRGRLVQVGDPETLYRHPADIEAARFFSELNEAEGRIEGGQVHAALGSFPVPAGLEGAGRVTVAVRPHDIALGPAGAGVAGRVASRRYLGEVDRVEVAIAGLAQPLEVRTTAIGAFAPGQTVGVTVPAARVHIFAQPAAA